MPTVADNQADIVLLSKANGGLDMSSACGVDGICNMITDSAWSVRVLVEGVATVVRKLIGHG